MVLETVGSSSKSNNIRSLLIQAWRERWSDIQWGIHIKTVLPRYISGDIYHLSDCILQQALMGPLPNQLILSYLRHSLAAQVVSYGGVIESISKYDSLHKVHCVRVLLELLSNIVIKLTCRGKPEDCLALATALVAGVKWLLKVALFASGKTTPDQINNLKKSISLLQEYLHCPFLMGLLHIARLEDSPSWSQLLVIVSELEIKLSQGGTLQECKEVLQKIFSDLGSKTYLQACEPSAKFDPRVTPICYGLHARVTVEAILHSTHTSQSLATHLLLYQQLKGLSERDLYLELLVTCFLGLGSNEEQPHQNLHWVGFTFIKVPSIIKRIHSHLHPTSACSTNPSPAQSQALLSAVQQLGHRTPLLDVADHKMQCNCLESLLRELIVGTSLLAESDATAIITQRQENPQAICVGGSSAAKEARTTQTALPNLILRAQPTVSSILRTLSNKDQESVLPVMNLLISGKSRDLLLTAAAASEKLYIYAQKFVKFNQQSLEPVLGESEVTAKSRALMFDITFLLLCHIAQVYNIEVVTGEEPDTFAEMWMKSHMPEVARVKLVSPQYRADHSGLMEVMNQVNASDMTSKYGQAHWDKVCRASPQIMQKLMHEYLNGSVSLTTATELIDRMCSHLCSLAVCFTAWTCSYLHEVTGDKAIKVEAILNHLQQKLTSQEPTLTLGFFTDRSLLMSEIINNMIKVTKETYFINDKKEQEPRTYDFYATLLTNITGNNNSIAPEDPNSSDSQLDTLMTETWEKVFRQSGVMSHKGLWRFQCLLRLGGHRWFVSSLVEMAMQNVFEADLNRALDLVYGILQIDQLECCIILLIHTVPSYFIEPGSTVLHSHRRIGALARLIVQMLVAAWSEVQQPAPTISASGGSPTTPNKGRKRSFSFMMGEESDDVLLRKAHCLKIDQKCLNGLSNSAVSLMVVMKAFYSRLCVTVPRGLVSPVSELVVTILQELVTAPAVITPLIALLPAKLLPILLALHPPVTFTPCHLLALALPQIPANVVSPLTPAMEACARLAAAKLLCTHRNLMLAASSDEEKMVLG